jgi:alkylated DNA repair dioxygenase AlkB
MNPLPHFLPQRLLFDEPPGYDETYARLERRWLDESAWVDVLPEWITGADRLFEQVLQSRTWGQRTRLIHGRELLEPRLTSHWDLASDESLRPQLVEQLRGSLSRRYGVVFDSVGFNLYRAGEDSVAWHRDHIPSRIREPVVALVSLGVRRRFLLRRRGGGASTVFHLGCGDLLVTGGLTQRTWEHCVPKVAHADPRISLAFRHGLVRGEY